LVSRILRSGGEHVLLALRHLPQVGDTLSPAAVVRSAQPSSPLQAAFQAGGAGVGVQFRGKTGMGKWGLDEHFRWCCRHLALSSLSANRLMSFHLKGRTHHPNFAKPWEAGPDPGLAVAVPDGGIGSREYRRQHTRTRKRQHARPCSSSSGAGQVTLSGVECGPAQEEREVVGLKRNKFAISPSCLQHGPQPSQFSSL
jgi:hypothetical protein